MRIPRRAKRVFKGIIFEVYQWPQKLINNTYTTFEMISKPNSVVIIPTVGQKILISIRKQAFNKATLALLGGYIKESEKPIEAAKRELLEETGLTSQDWHLLRSYKHFLDIRCNMYLYIARDCKKVTEPVLNGDEQIQLMRVSFSKLLSVIKSDRFLADEITVDLLRILSNKHELEIFKRKLFQV